MIGIEERVGQESYRVCESKERLGRVDRKREEGGKEGQREREREERETERERDRERERERGERERERDDGIRREIARKKESDRARPID